MKWVNATKIAQWADTKGCEDILPELLRKLIIGSAKKFPETSFPSGDSIYKPGWDGKCVSKEEYKYIPKDSSFWEIGRGKDFKKKCNSDYNKRTRQTKAGIRKKSTFVFVTPRRWDKAPLKDKWVEAKLKKKEWGNVIVYDADDIESWLEQTPAVGVWFAKELKLATGDVESAFDYWNRFVGKIKFTADLIISGRDNERDEILRFFAGEYGVKEVQASSEPEAICLTIASVISQGPIAETDFFSRTIIVSSKESLKTLAAVHENTNIIFDSKHDEIIDSTEARLNHIINPVSFNVSSSGIRVPLPKSENFIKSLEAIGYSFDRAIKLIKESGRSFSILKRILSESPGRVSWSEGNNILELLPIFLIQKFDENKVGGRQLIELFSKEDYNSYKDKLKKWSLIFDHPVIQIGNHWRVVSPYDLLHVIGRRISEHHLTQFEEVFVKVFSETDPALELEPKMRYAAAIFNKESPYSNRIREGLCQTLLLLAVYNESSGVNVNFNIQHWADRIVEKLLSNKSANFWLSIQNKLDLIAEASPSAFLKSLERMIKEEPEVIGSMFSDKDFDLFTPSYYTHILWALEVLAWDPTYLLRVTLVLSNLAELDKGVKTANKPINSLRHIFLLWLPQTFAPLKTRKEVIEVLIKRNQNAAFLLLKEISPRLHDTGGYNHKTIFRLRDYATEKVTEGEWVEGISFVRQKLSELASNNCDRWSQIIDLIDDFHGEERAQMINSFTSADLLGDVTTLRDKLRDFISRHESYSKQNWALSAQELSPLKNLYERLIIGEVDRYYWYFNVETIGRYGESGDNHDQHLKKSDRKRNDAIEIIFKSHGFEGIIELASRVERPWVVGYHLGETKDNLDNDVLPFLNKEDKVSAMTMGYVTSVSKRKGFSWVEEQAAIIAKSGESQNIANFFLACEPSSSVWDLLEQTSADANAIYWQKANFHSGFFRNNTPDLVRCIEKLNSHKRFASSINLIILRKEEVPAQVIFDTLDGLALYPVEDRRLEFGEWAIQQLFLQLDNRGAISESKMANLEWNYLQVLNDDPDGRPPKFLFKALEDPKFFSGILSWIYRPEHVIVDENKDLDSKTIFYRARNADELLNTWEKLPGENTEHEIDLQVFKTWIHAVVQECEKLDRKSKAYYAVGKLIGIARERSNKWPQPEFCQVIEEMSNEELNEGFKLGAINGSRVRAGLRPSGSNPERELSDHFKKLSESLYNRFPIVARLLLEIGKNYESWAQHSDLRDAQMDMDN